jgi:hypothetical protein
VNKINKEEHQHGSVVKRRSSRERNAVNYSEKNGDKEFNRTVKAYDQGKAVAVNLAANAPSPSSFRGNEYPMPGFEVAACDASHIGEWAGAWEACDLLRKSPSGHCTVKILSDGMVCSRVPGRFVRVNTAHALSLLQAETAESEKLATQKKQTAGTKTPATKKKKGRKRAVPALKKPKASVKPASVPATPTAESTLAPTAASATPSSSGKSKKKAPLAAAKSKVSPPAANQRPRRARKRPPVDVPLEGVYEVAACDADHEGEWKGDWEECLLLKRESNVCKLKILSDGMVCENVPERFVRRKQAQPKQTPAKKKAKTSSASPAKKNAKTTLVKKKTAKATPEKTESAALTSAKKKGAKATPAKRTATPSPEKTVQAAEPTKRKRQKLVAKKTLAKLAKMKTAAEAAKTNEVTNDKPSTAKRSKSAPSQYDYLFPDGQNDSEGDSSSSSSSSSSSDSSSSSEDDSTDADDGSYSGSEGIIPLVNVGVPKVKKAGGTKQWIKDHYRALVHATKCYGFPCKGENKDDQHQQRGDKLYRMEIPNYASVPSTLKMIVAHAEASDYGLGGKTDDEVLGKVMELKRLLDGSDDDDDEERAFKFGTLEISVRVQKELRQRHQALVRFRERVLGKKAELVEKAMVRLAKGPNRLRTANSRMKVPEKGWYESASDKKLLENVALDGFNNLGNGMTIASSMDKPHLVLRARFELLCNTISRYNPLAPLRPAAIFKKAAVGGPKPPGAAKQQVSLSSFLSGGKIDKKAELSNKRAAPLQKATIKRKKAPKRKPTGARKTTQYPDFLEAAERLANEAAATGSTAVVTPGVCQSVSQKILSQTKFPVELRGGTTVLGTGKLSDPPLCTKRYIFPIGYKSKRMHQSFTDPTKRVWYTQEIGAPMASNGFQTPSFTLTAEDAPGAPIVSDSTSTRAWNMCLQMIEAKKKELGMPPSGILISGPNFFGLTNKAVILLLEGLEGADKCKNYRFSLQKAVADKISKRNKIAQKASSVGIETNGETKGKEQKKSSK